MQESRTTIAITDAGVWAGTACQQDRHWSLTASAFRTCPVPGALRPETDLSAVADAAVEAVRAVGAQDTTVRLIVPATWVLTHSLNLPAGRFQRQTAAFEFETFLPVALEQLTCTFVSTDRAERYVGLAIPTQPIRALLDPLAQVGIQVDAVVPDYVRLDDSLETGAHVSARCDQSHAAVALWKDEKPVALRCCRFNGTPAPAIARDISALLPEDHDAVSVVLPGWVSEQLTGDVGGHLNLPVHLAGSGSTDGPPEALLLPAASDEWLNLRIDELAYDGRFQRPRRHALRCAALAAAVFLTIGLSSWVQRRQCDQAILALQEQERQVYSSVFPRQQVPPGAALRMASERRRLEGLTRSDAGQASEKPTDLLAQFREVVAAIPEKTRINVQELRLDRRELILRGLTAAHRDAEQIAAGLRRVDGLEPHPPRSDAIKEGGVSFSLRADCTGKRHEVAPGPPARSARLADAGAADGRRGP